MESRRGQAATPAMNITSTSGGLRLSQHGVVISELRHAPGPTHSVFDVLAALVVALVPAGRIGLLGFAGGSLLAPLRHLGAAATVAAVDLDPVGYELFRRHCARWAGAVTWEQADAADWLDRQPAAFDLLLDDLSVVEGGEVVKPAITWTRLPDLVRRRLRPGGCGVFNLLRPPGGNWDPELSRLVALYPAARVVDLDEFENRIVVVADSLPTARQLGTQLRASLRQLGSRQAGRIRIRTLR